MTEEKVVKDFGNGKKVVEKEKGYSLHYRIRDFSSSPEAFLVGEYDQKYYDELEMKKPKEKRFMQDCRINYTFKEIDGHYLIIFEPNRTSLHRRDKIIRVLDKDETNEEKPKKVCLELCLKNARLIEPQTIKFD